MDLCHEVVNSSFTNKETSLGGYLKCVQSNLGIVGNYIINT